MRKCRNEQKNIESNRKNLENNRKNYEFIKVQPDSKKF